MNKIFLLTTLCIMASCTDVHVNPPLYDMIPPQSEIGKNCAYTCQVNHEECEKVSVCHTTLCKEAIQQHLDECDKSYRDCFERCGGKIIQVQKTNTVEDLRELN